VPVGRDLLGKESCLIEHRDSAPEFTERSVFVIVKVILIKN
jgi:hypothetical protein